MYITVPFVSVEAAISSCGGEPHLLRYFHWLTGQLQRSGIELRSRGGKLNKGTQSANCSPRSSLMSVFFPQPAGRDQGLKEPPLSDT